jgi:hypothetical protein
MGENDRDCSISCKTKEVKKMLEQMPWWGWVVLAVLVIVMIPVKMRIMKKMLGGQKEETIKEEF